MNILMIGAGYVGLATGLAYAKLGHHVVCVEKDAAKIAKLDVGEAPFFEPGLPELLEDMQAQGSIMFTSDLRAVISGAEVVMIAVGTPASPTGEADLSAVFQTAEEIGRVVDHEVVVVIKSTVPVGTNRRVLARIKEVMREEGKGDLAECLTIASVPEFLREGSAITDFLSPDRIVIGCEDDAARTIVDRLHMGINAPRVFTTLESAELIKYAANAFLATKISFINEVAQVAERTGANVIEIARGIGLDRRIGPHFLQAGLGYGGSCFPKDVSALSQLSGTKGYHFKLLSSVIEVNNDQRDRFFHRIESVLGDVRGRRIAVWGLAFKSQTDDVRASAAIDIIQRLVGRGADVVAFDPQAMENARRVLPFCVQYAPTALDAAQGAEALLVLTEWPVFRQVSFSTLLDVMIEPRIFDGRNLLVDMNLSQKGFDYHGIGLGRREL